MVYCESCGREITPEALYCFYCGQKAPSRTVLGRTVVFETPVFCPECCGRCPGDAVYCGKCGRSLFERPAARTIFCPGCSEENRCDATVCNRCGRSLADWFAMRGEAATERGFTGDLTVEETMTGRQFRFLSQSTISFGREPDNDIVFPCTWVSGHHARIDMAQGVLRDLSSSNGTYINRRGDRINQAPLSGVNEFNLAGSFTFVVTRETGAFVFRLGAILDEAEIVAKGGDQSAFNALREQYFIMRRDNVDMELVIRKMDGEIDRTHKPRDECYQIAVKDGFYYYTDTGRGIRDQLLLKDKTGWPVNWKVVA